MIENLNFQLIENADVADREWIHQKLKSFNDQVSEPHRAIRKTGLRALNIFLRDDTGTIRGGLTSDTYWGWLEVDYLWIEESLRRHGYGERMLTMAEAEARQRGCTRVMLRTYSFQARGFYEKQGYHVVGQLDDYPPGQTYFWMRKDFAATLSDVHYVTDQYRAGNNLATRAALHERFSTAPRKWFDWYFDYLALPANARVLEIGCGTGALWRENRARVPESWQITLTDFSFGMIETTRAHELAAMFAQCDAQAIPFRDHSFDAVIANHMLYHVPDVPRALAEFNRVLRPHGKLYAATNGQAHLRELHALIGELAGIEQPFLENQFNLENGATFLAQQFSKVHRRDYADTLVVTAVEPLVAYALSGVSSSQVQHAHGAERLRERVTERIARDGALRITKSTGLFVAEK